MLGRGFLIIVFISFIRAKNLLIETKGSKEKHLGQDYTHKDIREGQDYAHKDIKEGQDYAHKDIKEGQEVPDKSLKEGQELSEKSMKKFLKEIEMKIQRDIKEKAVFIISKNWCSYCIKTKALLEKYPLDSKKMEILDIANYPYMYHIQDYMEKITGERTVPRVFIGGRFFGGGDQVEEADTEGRLEGILRDAGALLESGEVGE